MDFINIKNGVTLAEDYSKNKGINVIDWFFSIKYDGVRAIWTGKEFITRNNNKINVPTFFLDMFPSNIKLDGEFIYLDNIEQYPIIKSNFYSMNGLTKEKIPTEILWRRHVVYMVFDIPIRLTPFNERYDILKKILKSNRHIKIVRQVKVTSLEKLQKLEQLVVMNGGEGGMLKKHDSYYIQKRTKDLLKVKRFYDNEAIVLDYHVFNNILSSVLCKWVNGPLKDKIFEVGSGFNDYDRLNYQKVIPKGKIITVKYFEINDNLPRFPTYKRN